MDQTLSYIILGPLKGILHKGKITYLAERELSDEEKEDYLFFYREPGYVFSKENQEQHLQVVRGLNKDDKQILNNGLIAAAQVGHLKVIKYLEAHGADMRIHNYAAILHASENGDLDMVKYLTSQLRARNPEDLAEVLNEAVQDARNSLPIIKYLASIGADLSAGDNSLFRWAIDKGNLRTVKYLASQGVKVTGGYGIKMASAYKNLRLLKYLVLQGASIDYKDNTEDDTALSVACLSRNIPAIKYLISQDPSIIEAGFIHKIPLLKYMKQGEYKEVFEYIESKEKREKSANKFLRLMYIRELIEKI